MSNPFSAVSFSFELGFGSDALAAAPTWTDVSAFVKGFKISRGRSSLLSRFDAGVAVLTLENNDGRFDPNNTSSPYSPNVLIGVPVRITVTHNAVAYVLFRGMVEAWPLAYDDIAATSVVQLPCVELGKILAGRELAEVVFSQQKSDARVAAVLDQVGWPAGLRNLEAGVTEVAAAAAFTGKALDHITDVADAEAGTFFVARTGDATFLNRVTYAGGAVSAATFGPAASELAFEQIVLTYDDDELYDEAVVTRTGGTPQQADDGGTVLATITRESDVFLTDSHALNVAEWLVEKHKEQRVRVRSLTLKPQFDETNMWPQILGRDLADAVTVKFTPPGGATPLNQLAAIQAISHEVRSAAGEWVTRWTLAPLSTVETNDFWVLGTSRLDVDTRLA